MKWPLGLVGCKTWFYLFNIYFGSYPFILLDGDGEVEILVNEVTAGLTDNELLVNKGRLLAVR